MSRIVIETHSLSRTYQTYQKSEGVWNSVRGFWNRNYILKPALRPTTLSIEGGQIVGLVGANGAGKTTLLKLLSGLIYPSAGDALVLGFRPWERKYAFLKRMSILLGQKNQLWWDIPASDSFDLLARIYDLERESARARVQTLAQMLDCTALLNVQLRRLSLGERMKMEIIGSLLHKPDILFLDEPTIGLDVVAQTTIRHFLADYVKTEGPTVILTSHYMDDIAKLANRLLLISRGELVYDGTVSSFMEKSQTYQLLTMRFSSPLVRDIHLSDGLTLHAGQQDFQSQVPSGEIPRVITELTSASRVAELKIEEANFEDIIRKFLESESRFFSAGSRHES